MAALSHQRENGALGIGAAEDPSVTCHFDRTIENLPVACLHTLCRIVDVAVVEIIKPERHGHCGRLGEHSANGDISDREQLIGAHLATIGLRFLPAKKRFVEMPNAVPVGGEEFMPAYVAGRVQVRKLLMAILDPLEN